MLSPLQSAVLLLSDGVCNFAVFCPTLLEEGAVIYLYMYVRNLSGYHEFHIYTTSISGDGVLYTHNYYTCFCFFIFVRGTNPDRNTSYRAQGQTNLHTGCAFFVKLSKIHWPDININIWMLLSNRLIDRLPLNNISANLWVSVWTIPWGLLKLNILKIADMNTHCFENDRFMNFSISYSHMFNVVSDLVPIHVTTEIWIYFYPKNV